MSPLPNARYERFAQAIVAGLAGETRIERAQSTAYRVAYPTCSEGNSAEAAASRLLSRVKPILERVRELQAQAAHDLKETPETIAVELNQIKNEARADKAHAAAVSAVLGKAKILGLIIDKHQDTTQKQSFANAKSLHDIGVLLLQQVGVTAPSDEDISLAIRAHNQLLDTLNGIAERHQVVMLEE
jgi:phage terminase small subunit